MEVTEITEEGIKAIIITRARFRKGDNLEDIAADLGMDKVDLQVLLAAADLLGVMDVIEQAEQVQSKIE